VFRCIGSGNCGSGLTVPQGDNGLGDLDWRRTLADVIKDNTGLEDDDVQSNVFIVTP